MEEELARVFISGGEELPGYTEKESDGSSNKQGVDLRESGVVIKSGSGTEEHTAEAVTSEEAKTNEEVRTSEDGSGEGEAKKVDLKKESFVDAVKMVVEK